MIAARANWLSSFCFLWAVLLLGLFMLGPTPAMAQTTATCSAATSQGTAPATWQTYCWLDFTGYNETTSRSAAGQNFSYTLSDGAILSFNVKTSGSGLTSITAPSWTGAAVGNTAFLGIPGRPIMYQTGSGSSVFTVSNILITPPPGAPAVTAYMFVAADAESTDNSESIQFQTNGGNWQLLDQVPPISGSTYPTQSGIGTQNFLTAGGGATGNVGGYIIGSTSPTTVTTTLNGGGLQGAMFAVRFASMRLNKQIVGARVDPADQFKFDIRATSSSAILGTGTSTGTGNGPFAAAAVSLASGVPLTLTETMAAGSVSSLSQYRSRLSCTNGTAGSSTPLPTNLATTNYNFGALQFGDAIQCTFTNRAFPHVRLQKALGATGRLFDTDQFVMNIRQGATTIATTTTTGTGTTVSTGATPMTQVTAGTAYNFSESASGSTTMAQYSATVLCANAWAGSPTVLPTTFPANITPQLGDVITCTITNIRAANNANLTATKSSEVIDDLVSLSNPKSIPSARVRYAITIANTGSLTVDTNSMFVVDVLPANMTYNASVPAIFTQGTPTSGLTFNPATDIRFAGAGAPPTSFAACTLPAGTGYNPAIRYVCIRPQGTMAGGTGTGQPNFSIAFETRID
jgi:uncharacterized repeat protein (TIGR01451 family)